MKILVTGSNGLLGQKVIYGLLGDPIVNIDPALLKDVSIIAAAKGENRLFKKDGYIFESLDITNADQVKAIIAKYKPHAVINTAAMTNVDACETQREECWAANVTAMNHLVEACTFHGSHLVHVSTDFVFDGMKGEPYVETDEPNPLHYYAKSKWEGEKIVMAGKATWAILRTIIVYGVVDGNTRSNLVLWVKNNLQKGQKIKVINDQYRAPTLSEDLAFACIMAAFKRAKGIYHVSGDKTESILELANKIADFWKLDKSLMQPVTSEELNQPAKRPPRTGFIIDKAKKLLGYNPHSFEEGLKIVDQQIKKFQ